MKVIQKADLQEIVREIKASNHTFEAVREIVNSKIRLYDLIPAPYIEPVFKIVKLMYNRADKGRNGKHEEAIDRIYTLVDNGVKVIPFREFFAYKQGHTDIYDKLARRGYEKKTGTGDWLIGESPDLAECIKRYSRKRTLIRWDYVRADKGIEIHIETSYKKLFAYLLAYNPEKGLESWFIPSCRTENGLNGRYIWKMQEIMTSKKKIAYLNSWKG